MRSRPPQIREAHLMLKVVGYMRVSTAVQVRDSVGSIALQRDQVKMLLEWGWRRELIELRDEDLGRSGSIPGQRHGFDRLLDDMRAGLIGAVAVTDISRLIRNDYEEAMFAITARQYDVLLIHGTNVVDYRDPNNAFVARILGINAGRENSARIAQSRAAKRKKAEDGIAVTGPPIGYVRGPNGTWIKHPDPRVREVILLVFDKFIALGSARAVWRYLQENGIKLPHPRRGPTL